MISPRFPLPGQPADPRRVAYMSPARYYLVRILAAQSRRLPGAGHDRDSDPTAAKTVNVLLMDVPDLNVTTISNVNTCINKVVIPTWATTPRDTILYWFEVPMAVRPNYVAYDKFQELRVRFTTSRRHQKNNAFIVKNFGSGLCEIDFRRPP
eukprot:tig00021181_g19330.t1